MGTGTTDYIFDSKKRKNWDFGWQIILQLYQLSIITLGTKASIKEEEKKEIQC